MPSYDDSSGQEDLLWGPPALEAKRQAMRDLQARIAGQRNRWVRRNRYFYRAIRQTLRFCVEPGKRVLNVRCGNGWFLDALQPSRGVGVDLTDEMVEVARQRCPQYEFVRCDPESLELDETFDYVLFNYPSDTVDVVEALKRIRRCCAPRTRLILYHYNRLWQPLVKLAEWTGLKMPMTEQNWLSEHSLINMLRLAGFEHLTTHREVLLPKWIPLVSGLFNRFIARMPLLRRLCLIKVLVAAPAPEPRRPEEVSVSVVVPCRNEAGNIEDAVRRTPEMGRSTELIFCDDQSTDGTAEMVRKMQRQRPDRNIRLVDGPGVNKAANVWTGFTAATGDVVMILDADLTVMPEELPAFFEAIVSGKGELINGTRLIYPMPKGAMKTGNMIGNKLFGLTFSYLLGQRLTDTLCGTKVMWRSDWHRIHQFHGSWGTADRWGDYELLFGAARLNLRITELPVHYQERVYGVTKMVRVFRHGLVMLRMCGRAFWRFKARFGGNPLWDNHPAES